VNAGQLGVPQYRALLIAAHRPRQPGSSTGFAQYYLVNDRKRRVIAGPVPSPAGLPHRRLGGTKVVKVNAGTVLVRAERARPGSSPGRWYVLNDRPALTGADIREPKAQVTNGKPSVTFSFSGNAAAKWHDLTRTIVQRASALAPPNPPRTPDGREYSSHFAVTLDNDLVTVPYISYITNPDGIAGTSAEIAGNFTQSSARDLAALLSTGALGVRLRLMSRS
jgi:preprotein translocase subunit SecD